MWRVSLKKGKTDGFYWLFSHMKTKKGHLITMQINQKALHRYELCQNKLHRSGLQPVVSGAQTRRLFVVGSSQWEGAVVVVLRGWWQESQGGQYRVCRRGLITQTVLGFKPGLTQLCWIWTIPLVPADLGPCWPLIYPGSCWTTCMCW